MIYLFDKDERLIKLIKKDAIKTALQKFALTTEKYVSDRLTVEMKALSKQEFDAVEYMAIQSIEDEHTFHYFYIAQKFSGNLTTLIGVQSGIEELRKSVVLDKRPHNTFARPIINELLAGTNWQARYVSETSQRSTNFYYISTFEALKKVCQVWNLEMQFFVEVNGNKIGGRYIDFKQKIGEATGKRVVYGHNALQILQEVERTNLFTALIGRGKGEEISAPTDENNTGSYGRRITFEDVVWETKKGNPVDKPKGQKYVELPEMTKRYGIKNADGSMRAKVGFAVFEDEEDKNALIKRTYDELVNASRPQLTLKTSTVYLKGVKIGDTIRVVRHDKKLDYDTRIFEITFNRLNNESSDIKLGDRISESNEAKIQNIASQKVDELVSSGFNNIISKLPEFLPSADGFNNNWYGTEDPTVKHSGKVLINDIWFKPDPEHEGHKIMLRWTGEIWDEILRSYDKESLKKRISEEIANFDKSFQSVNERNKKKIDEILQSSGASNVLAQEAKRIGLDSITKLEEFKRQATSAQTALSGDLDVLKRTVTSEVNQASEYRRTTTEALSRMTGQMNGFATKSEVKQGIDGLTQTFAKMKVGGRNYAEDYDFSRGLWQYSQGDSSPQDWTILNGEYNVKGTTNTWKQMQIHSKEGSRASGKSSTALLDLEIGETYTLSFQGICYSGSPKVWLSLRANRTAPGNPEIMYGTFNLTSSWQTYQVTIPALTKPDNFDFWRIILGYSEIGHVAFRKVELTRSSTRIDAGPAPEDGKTDLVVAKSEFQKTADGLSAKLATVENYVGQDGQRQEALRRYTREESAKQATSVRELVTRDYVGKSAYQEDVRGLERRFEAITNPQNGSIATQIAKYKTAVDGRFADITSMISGKANQTDFQRVRETSQLYERILGNTNNSIVDNVARMAMTSQLFQVEVSKAAKGGRNYIRNGQFKNGSKNWLEYQSVNFGLNFNYQHSQNPNNRNRPGLHFYHESQDVANFFGIQQSFAFDGVRGEKVSVSLLVSKDGGDSNSGLRVALHYIKNKNIIGQEWQGIPSPQITSKYKRFTFTFTLSDDVENLNLMLYGEKGKTINLYVTDVQLERGSVATDYKEAHEDTDEAIRSVQTQLADSWSVQNINSAGDLISGINLGANGYNRFDGKLTHITGETLIDKAVIKSAMIAEAQINTAHIDSIDATNGRIINLSANNFTANRVEGLNLIGGDLTATNGAMKINLNKGQYEVYTEEAAMRRVVAGFPNQFIKFATGKQEVEHEEGVKSGVTVIGSNSDGSEDGNNQTFAGIQIWNNAHQRNVNSIGDYMRVSNKGFGENEKGWIIQTSGTPSIAPITADGKPETGKRSAILSGDFYFINKWGQSVSLLGILERFIVNFNTLRDKRGMLHTDFPELN